MQHASAQYFKSEEGPSKPNAVMASLMILFIVFTPTTSALHDLITMVMILMN